MRQSPTRLQVRRFSLRAVSKFAGQWIDIFRVGDYGAKGNFTEADLDRVAASYDPAAHEAPLTIGHPKDNLPAFGWVSGVRRVGGLLQAQFSQVDPVFESMVAEGKFNKRSASLYKHPETGQVVGLRHVAFLGAQPPEVKGLQPIQFHDAGQKSTEVDFQESAMVDEANLVERIIAKIEEKFGKKPVEAPAASFSEADVKKLIADLFPEALKPLEAKIAAYETSFSEGQKTAATAATKARAAESVTKLKTAGKWVPAFEKMGLSVVFDELAKTNTTVEFGEGDAKKTLTPLEVFVSFMEQLGTIVPSAPVYTGQNARRAAVEGLPANVDGNSAALDGLVRARMKQKGVSYTVAFDEVSKDHVDLLVPGGLTAGAI